MLTNFRQKICCIDIGTADNADYLRWENLETSAKIFPVDIVAARAAAVENYFMRIDKPEMRSVFTRKKNIVFTIMSDSSVPTQYLEAAIEEIRDRFLGSYEAFLHTKFIGGVSIFEGFKKEIPSLLETVELNHLKKIRVFCKLCNTQHELFVKKRMIEVAKKYPVTFVYMHRGQGLLIYIDANFKVRGVEIVEIAF